MKSTDVYAMATNDMKFADVKKCKKIWWFRKNVVSL